MDKRVRIIWKSLFVTILIFGFAILFNHFLDFWRIDVVTDVMAAHELDRDAFLAQQSFVESFAENGCSILKKRFSSLQSEIRNVGDELSTYSKFSLFKKKDFDYLKRKYFLLEFELLAIVQRLNDMCGRPYLPVLFFYEIDQEASERQGFILDDLSAEYDNTLVVLSIDKNYKDEPIVNTLIDIFNITKAPTIIIGKKKVEGLINNKALNKTIHQELNIADPYAKEYDIDFTIKATGEDKDDLINSFRLRSQIEYDPFTKADLLFILSRLTKNDSMLCSALSEFKNVDSETPEEMALVYETIASIDCGNDKESFYRLAAKEWEKIGKQWRADFDYALAQGEMPDIVFDIAVVQPALKKGNYSKVILGNTKFVVDDSTKILVQTDRVTRDWLAGTVQNPFKGKILNVFSEKKRWDKNELREDIGWHEGGRLDDLLSVDAKYVIGTGTLIAKTDDKWFAPDENGIFRFEVPIDKVLYPTTRFLRKDLAVIIDTHGVNMLVDQALSHDVDLVIGCGDHPAKAAAAKYLSDKGISVVSFPNKFFHLLLGQNTSVLGSPPLNISRKKVILGDRPVEFTTKDIFVVANSTNAQFSLWYYQTPEHYFSVLEKFIPLNVSYFTMTGFAGQPDLLMFAMRKGANVIATRVYNKRDYEVLADWLKKSDTRRVILFHSSSYPYGVKLFNDFPTQTTFGDVNPVLK